MHKMTVKWAFAERKPRAAEPGVHDVLRYREWSFKKEELKEPDAKQMLRRTSTPGLVDS